MILAALLLGAGVGVLAVRPPSARRLTALVRAVPEVGQTSNRALRGPALLVLGGVTWWLIGGWVGAAVGAAVAFGGPPLLARLDAGNDPTEELLALQLPLALDLVGACLAGGSPLADALASVADAVGGPAGARLSRVAGALSVGTPTEEAFGELGDTGAAGSASRALRRAAEGGTPVAAAVSRVAQDARRAANTVARKKVKRAGAQAAAPITVCFLPAFLLLGTVPCVIAVAGPLLNGF